MGFSHFPKLSRWERLNGNGRTEFIKSIIPFKVLLTSFAQPSVGILCHESDKERNRESDRAQNTDVYMHTEG